MGKRNRKLPPTITKGKQSTLGVQDSSDSDSTSTTVSASGGGTHKRSRSGFFTSNKLKSEKNERNSPASAAAPNPTEFVTGGVRVKFPFTPYKSQQDMMSKIVEALQKQENALLESPTGSGKSLALLCGALAWLEAEKESAVIQRRSKYEAMKQEITESPYFANPAVFDHPTDTTVSGSSSSSITTSCGTGCGTSLGPCGSRSGKVKEEPVDPGRPSMLAEALGSGCRSRTVSEKPESEGDDDDFFQETKTLKMREAVEINYESEIPSLGTKDAERSGLKAVAPNESRGPLPKIYFGSRTHKQITQLVKELKSNTVYRPKMVVLGGRNHYCINPKLKKNVDKNDACQELLDAENCIYKHKVGDLFEKMVRDKKGHHRIWDMEDLIRKGNAMNACPYFAARSLALGAELIFCPYNYLIDPSIRKAMDIDLDNAIVILDEAHNIESTSRDAGGLDVQHEDLKQANREFGDMIKHNVLENSCRKLIDLSTMFLHILEEQTTFSIQNYEESTELWSSQDLIRSLDRFGLNRRSIVSYRSACDEMSKALKDKKEMQKGRRPGPASHLSELEEEIRKQVITSPRVMRAMEGIVVIMDRLLNCNPNDLDDYKIALVESVDRGWVQEDVEDSDDNQKKKKTRNPFRQGHSVQKKKEILFWCLNPGVIFRTISTRARSVILTSGTLSPLDSFASELQTSFSITLEADHVVDTSHVWAGVLPLGPTKVRLDGTYKSVNTFEFQDELGRVIERVIETTPHGVLCFVSSYSIIDNLMNRWQQTGQYNKLSAIKEVILEPRKATNEVFDKTLKRFYTIIADEVAKGSNGGALLFAVYRGKCSEGIDFTDSNCRAVLAVSIPFPSLTDLKIKLKKEYNDQRSVRRPLQLQPAPAYRPQSLLDIDLQSINHSTSVSSGAVAPALPVSQYRPPILLSGKRWYEIQAFRAYNQAIGRCIRHRKDWGAMVLLDHRFTQPHNRESLSKWARPLAKTFPVFEDAMADMKAWIAPLQREHEASLSSSSSSGTAAGPSGIPAMFAVMESSSYFSEAPGTVVPEKTTLAMASLLDEARTIKSEPNFQTETGALWVLDTHGDRLQDPVRAPDQDLTQRDIVELVPDTAEDMVVDEDMDESHWVTPPEGSPQPELPSNEVPENEGKDRVAEDVSMFSGDDDLDMSQGQQGVPSRSENQGHGAAGAEQIFFEEFNLGAPADTKTYPAPVDGVGTGSSSSSGSISSHQQQNAPPPLGTPTFQRSNSLSSMMNSWQGTRTDSVAQTPLLDNAVRILCKTCNELLLICASRPKIKTVHKSMAEDLLLNRRRLAAELSGANPLGTQVIAHTHTQVTQIPTTPTAPDHRRTFQRSNSNMSLTGGESSTPSISGGPKAMILVVHGSNVLQTPFDRHPNADEYDCIWRPQDSLCYRRIMCPKCGQKGAATAKASSHERTIPGWRGVIVVTTTGGVSGSKDEALDRGAAWLTPGETRYA
ncbi:hypothetical protein MVEG_04345 [Podila verticillata NRRL 6337]|nr:hypothetical protein MVEG_04345 [Podila verticillata NRRL 6337]